MMISVARLLIIESLFALLIVSPQSNPPTVAIVVAFALPLNPCWFASSLDIGTTVNVLPDFVFALANVFNIVMFSCCLFAPS